jgi:hypothetical protein
MWKPRPPGQKSNQLLDIPGSPPTDQSYPRNSQYNPNLHESQAPNIREGIWDEIFWPWRQRKPVPLHIPGRRCMGGGGRKMNAHRHPPGYGINKPCLAQVWVAAWTSKPGRKKINDGVGKIVDRKLFKFSVRLLRDPKIRPGGHEKGK